MDNLPVEHIEEALDQIELIDSLLPEALPLYINHQWISSAIRERYKERLANAAELLEIIERVTNNPDT